MMNFAFASGLRKLDGGTLTGGRCATPCASTCEAWLSDATAAVLTDVSTATSDQNSARAHASEIGASEATVKIHRGNLMEKMQAGSLIEFVRMADKLKLVLPK